MGKTRVWLDGADMLLTIKNLTDSSDDSSVTSGTMEITDITDRDGNSNTGLSFPISLSHQSGGTWTANLDNSANLEVSKLYKIELSLDNGSGIKRSPTIHAHVEEDVP